MSPGRPIQGVPLDACGPAGPFGPLIVKADAALPGDPTPGPPHTRFHTFALDGDTIYFVADNANSNNVFQGLFSMPLGEGDITRIPAVGDRPPRSGHLHRNRGPVRGHHGTVVFLAYFQNGGVNPRAILVANGGNLMKRLATGDMLDGAPIHPNPGTISNGIIAFTPDSASVWVAVRNTP